MDIKKKDRVEKKRERSRREITEEKWRESR